MKRASFNFEKREVYFLFFVLVGVILLGFVAAFNSGFSGGSPSVFGHSSDEVLVRLNDGSVKSLQDAIAQGNFGSGAGGQWQNGAGGAIYYNGGNVGIGTVPGRKLEVKGDVGLGNGPNNEQLYIQGFNNYVQIQPTRPGVTNNIDLVVNSNGGKLIVGGNATISDNDFFFRADSNHGVGWYGPNKLFDGAALDGPVLYGYSGGALGVNRVGVQKAALVWNSNGNVGVGTFSPGANLEVGGGALRVRNAISPELGYVDILPPNVNGFDNAIRTGFYTASEGFYFNNSFVIGFAGSDASVKVGVNPQNMLELGFKLGSNFIQTSDSVPGNGRGLSLNPSGGNVGVGKLNPQSALDVIGDVNVAGGDFKSTRSPKPFKGKSVNTVQGDDAQGYLVMDSWCGNDFAGSRMCRAVDFELFGAPTEEGWYSTMVSDQAGSDDCAGWTSTVGYGNVWKLSAGQGQPMSSGCWNSNFILCCGW